jgi:hypothetical protein
MASTALSASETVMVTVGSICGGNTATPSTLVAVGFNSGVSLAMGGAVAPANTIAIFTVAAGEGAGATAGWLWPFNQPARTSNPPSTNPHTATNAVNITRTDGRREAAATGAGRGTADVALGLETGAVTGGVESSACFSHTRVVLVVAPDSDAPESGVVGPADLAGLAGAFSGAVGCVRGFAVGLEGGWIWAAAGAEAGRGAVASTSGGVAGGVLTDAALAAEAS